MVSIDRQVWCVLVGLLGVSIVGLQASAQDKAMRSFPSAEGFGAYAAGGRGGKIVLVTNLDDYVPGKDEMIPGSLRAACSIKGPRLVLFRISGMIPLKARLAIDQPYLTIAGRTAPGEGICLKNHATVISTHDVIVRNIRFRPGDEMGMEPAALWLVNASDVIIDHCSVSWGRDGTLLATGDSKNITVQWCVISESLDGSKRGHGRGSLLKIREGGMTFHHNIFAHNRGENPEVAAHGSEAGPMIAFRNNVIYNWRDSVSYSGKGSVRIDYVGNYLKQGPSTSDAKYAFVAGGKETRIYMAGNLLIGQEKTREDNSRMVRTKGRQNIATRPLSVERAPVQAAKEAYDSVLTNCGAILPRRDSADRRVIENIRAGTGGLVDSQKDVGGWPLLLSDPPPKDTDNDGMPDIWELKYGLSPKRAGSDTDSDKDGYSNIEEYINGTSPRKPDGGREK